MNIEDKIKKIKLLLLDVDGVLTAGDIYYGGEPDEIKKFDVKDGLGIKLAQAGGITIGIISGRQSEALRQRASDLDIEILYQGQIKKITAYQQIKQNLFLKDEQIAYVADDLNDLKIFQQVGLRFAVNDACEDIRKLADYVTSKPGGKGAVREVVELILKAQGKWVEVINNL